MQRSRSSDSSKMMCQPLRECDTTRPHQQPILVLIPVSFEKLKALMTDCVDAKSLWIKIQYDMKEKDTSK